MPLALYRKYRPRTFDDLVGQAAVSTTLKRQAALGRLSHAYLFTGSRGTGKTSAAKILAKAANCLDSREGDPCCECEICIGIEAESLLDVTEIDAASNSGVDNIRELREQSFFTPAVAKYRVYIVDECHMLSQGAFNALLKIMEEPPPHVLFILATTELHKVPATILSRCQRFDFQRLSSTVIAGRLIYVAGHEGIALEDDAALLIAKLADGGMRDALSLLDLVATSGEKVTSALVRERVGLASREHLFLLGRAVAGGDFGEVLEVLAALCEKAFDYQRISEQLVVFYRDLMVAKAIKDPGELIACLPEELEQYKELAGKQSMARIMGWLGTTQEILIKMSRGFSRRAELEAGLLRMTSPDFAVENTELPKRAPAASKRAEPVAQHVPAPSTIEPPTPPIEKIPMEPFERWAEVLDELGRKNKALYGTLVDSSAYVSGELLLVDAGEDSMFAGMVRTDSYAKESLRAAAEAVTGNRYKLGPYNPERYEAKPAAQSKLDDILKQAGEMGVDVKVEG
ncbi:MAG: DNA polymerase III subunit gamma/tau [Oscillospiraceae bacterium]|nr:DNA polymerase III subunit gamma/tau [Oscillospiraceae bacterium]